MQVDREDVTVRARKNLLQQLDWGVSFLQQADGQELLRASRCVQAAINLCRDNNNAQSSTPTLPITVIADSNDALVGDHAAWKVLSNVKFKCMDGIGHLFINSELGCELVSNTMGE